MNNKITLVNLYQDIVLVTRVRIFCTALFTNNNIKVVIQIDAFLAHLQRAIQTNNQLNRKHKFKSKLTCK